MENIEAMLCAYIEGDLDEAGRAEIEKHLQSHPQHRKLIDELIATRNLVRDLPRAQAPADVAEGLRGHVERSLLLDGEGEIAARPSRMRLSRWPQYVAVAAVFVLTAGLALVVLKMVMPPARPAPVGVAIAPAPASKPAEEAATEEEPTAGAHGEIASANAANGLAFRGPVLADERMREVAKQLPGQDRSAVYLVIDSQNPSMTGDKVRAYLTSNNITFTPIPTTKPTDAADADRLLGGMAAGGGRGEIATTRPAEQKALQYDQEPGPRLAVPLAGTTLPSDQTVQMAAAAPGAAPAQDKFDAGGEFFVARNMTRKQADDLRQELTRQEAAPATPSDGQTANNAAPSTQPSQIIVLENTAVAKDVVTQPSALPAQTSAAPNSTQSADQAVDNAAAGPNADLGAKLIDAQAEPMDVVIFVKNAAGPQNNAAPVLAPVENPPTTQPQ